MPTRRATLPIFAIALLTRLASAGPIAAGDESGVWVAALGSQSHALLFFIPPDSTDGVAHVAASFPILPIAIACEADTAFLLFPRQPSATPNVEIYPARLIKRGTDAPSRPEFTRLEVLAPLPEGGEILRVTLADETPLILRRTVAPSGPTLSLEALRANEWRSIKVPAAIDPTADTWLIAIARRPLLAQQKDPKTLRLWTLASFEKPGSGEWTEQDVTTPVPIDDLLAFPTGPRAIKRDADTIETLTLQDGALTPAQTIHIDRTDAATVPCNAGLALLWPDARNDSGLDIRLLSNAGGDGTTIFDGPLTIAGPVSQTELQVLVVLLGSVFFAAVIFMLRPELRAAAPLNFPPNASLAAPSRRFVAFLIDLVPGIVVAYLLWFTGARTVEAVSAVFSEQGAAPMLAIAAVTILLSTVGEATTGRTLGKALTRCRTISYDGRRPRWGQALARNTVKVLCPPIGLFILLAPASPHPGSFDTLVIVDHPPEPGQDTDPPPGAPPRDPPDPS